MIQKIFIFLTLALGTFPLLKLNFISILTIVWTGFALINAYQNRYFQTFSFAQNKKYIWLIALLIPYIIYLPFADDFNEIGKMLQRGLPLLVFTFGFVLNKKIFTPKHLHYLFNIFIISTLLTNCKGWIGIFQIGFVQAWHQNDFYNPIFRNIFSEKTGIHLPYLGLISIWAAIILFFRILHSKKHLFINSLGILFLLGSAYIYTARMALLGFFICVIFLIWKSIPTKKIKVWSLILSLFILYALWFSPLKNRIRESITQEWVLPHQEQQPHQVNFRYGILYCTAQVIKDNFLWGVKPDQAQQSLNNCYSHYTYSSYDDFTKIDYNSHNQYLDYTLKFGVFGGLFLIFTLFYYFRNGHLLYQTFILLISFAFLTENILERQIGLTTYAFFNIILVIFADTYKGILFTNQPTEITT